MILSHRFFVSVLLAACMAGSDASQSSAPSTIPARERIISAADLLYDLGILQRAYEELHPGLYRYNTKLEMDRRFADLKTHFTRDRSLADAYLTLSTFAAQIKCGHTYPNFFNQEKDIAKALFQGQDRVPFYFRWLGDRMIVTDDFTPDHSLPRGTEILSINQIPSATILGRLMTIARADGSNDAKRKAYLEVTGDDSYEAFDVYFSLFYPSSSKTMSLSVKRPKQNEAQIINVVPLTYEQRVAPIDAKQKNLNGGNGVAFEWKYLENGAAYLRMPSWALYNSKWDWKAWLNERLDELADRNPLALIVDLRGNEGGNDVGDEILKRLAREDLKISSYRRLVRYRKTPADLNPYLDTWDRSFQNWGDAAKELPQPWPTAPPVHYFLLTRYDDDAVGNDVIPAIGKPFRGQVFVLIDPSNSSATFQFARLVQEKKLGRLVGQPTGGNLRGINGGAFFFLRLPKSQIEMDLPLIATFPSTPQPDTGLTPDLPVVPTLDDIVEGRDPGLEQVTQLLKGK